LSADRTPGALSEIDQTSHMMIRMSLTEIWHLNTVTRLIPDASGLTWSLVWIILGGLNISLVFQHDQRHCETKPRGKCETAPLSSGQRWMSMRLTKCCPVALFITMKKDKDKNSDWQPYLDCFHQVSIRTLEVCKKSSHLYFYSVLNYTNCFKAPFQQNKWWTQSKTALKKALMSLFS